MRSRYGSLRALRACTLLALWPVLFAGRCGPECEPMEGLPAPMTEARAKQIAPEVTTGLAFSTTRVRGDCRPKATPADPPADACAGVTDTDCARERAPMRVFVVKVNVSVPVAAACRGSGGFAAGDLAALAAADFRASAGGELVLAVESGAYRVYLSLDDRCAACGLEGAAAGCLVEVPPGRVIARDLVLDQAAH